MFNDLLLPSLLGFALLLAGMKVMEAALGRWAGNKLSGLIARSTSTPLRGFAIGTAASAMMQSSTAVTVLTIGFVNAGWLSMARSFAIILGTNVGTCLTTELMGFKLHRFGSPLLIAALLGWLLTAVMYEMRSGSEPNSRGIALRYISIALGGFALLLIGFSLLQGMGPSLESNGYFDKLMDEADSNPLWGVLGGAVLTALIHSSAAVIALCMGLAGSFALTPEAGIAIVLGANIGTCFTGLVASLSGGRGGKFVALSQLALNVGGALLFYPLIGLLYAAAAYLAPDDPAAQIARAQTLFNVACSMLALPLAYLPRWRA